MEIQENSHLTIGIFCACIFCAFIFGMILITKLVDKMKKNKIIIDDFSIEFHQENGGVPITMKQRLEDDCETHIIVLNGEQTIALRDFLNSLDLGGAEKINNLVMAAEHMFTVSEGGLVDDAFKKLRKALNDYYKKV